MGEKHHADDSEGTANTVLMASPSGGETASLPIVDRTRYTLLDEIARGGLGRVLRAHDTRLQRVVALKQPIDGAGGRSFLYEALLTAKLQHPAIVPIYDAGYFGDGTPFYAMKLVQGRTLAGLIAAGATLDERLTYLPNVIAVTEAIAFAHSLHVVHLDLKPSNILVGTFGETVVVDWGLGRVLAETRGALTDSAIAGTPAYMAPEQARGEPVDETADVYALGAILYHLLSGCPPYDTAPSEEILALVRAAPPRALTARTQHLPSDLIAIVDRALARQADRRYPNAAELAADLRRFQTGQLVLAHRYSAGARLQRWIRRQRVPIIVAALFFVVLAAFAAVSLVRIVSAEKSARERAAELTVRQASQAVDRDPAEAVGWLRMLSVDASSAGAPRLVAVRAVSAGVPVRVWGRGAPQVNNLALAADGHTLLAADDQGKVRILDTASPSASELIAHIQVGILYIRRVGDGGRFATAAPDHTARIWGADRVELARMSHPEHISALDASADGDTLVTGANDGMVRIWSGSGEPRAEIAAHTPGAVQVSVSPDGRWLASGGVDGKVRLWSSTGVAIHSWDVGGAVAALAFSVDGRRLAAGGADARARAWEADTGRLLVDGDTGGSVESLAFGARGQLAVVGEGGVWVWDGQARRISADSGQQIVTVCGDFVVSGHKSGSLTVFDVPAQTSHRLVGHHREVTGLVCVPDKQLASAGADGTVRLWPLEDPNREYRGQGPSSFAVSPDGQWLALLSSPGVLRLAGLRGRADRYLPLPGGRVRQCEFSSDGRRLAVIANPGVYVYEMPAGAFRPLPRAFSQFRYVEFSRDGTWLAGASNDGLAIWDLDRGGVETFDGNVIDLAIAADGRTLVTAGWDGVIRMRNLATGASEVLGHHDAAALNVEISPDGGTVASVAKDGSVLRFDLGSHRQTLLGRHSGQARKARFSPDGERLASAGGEGTILVWPLKGGVPARLHAESSEITAISFSRDSKRLVTGALDGTVRLWDVDSGWSEILGTFPSPPEDAGFTPDGQWVGVADTSGMVRLWSDAAPTEPRALERWIAHLTADELPQPSGAEGLRRGGPFLQSRKK